MSAIWVVCSDCGYKFDIEDSIKADFKCPICHSQSFEYDDEIEKFDDFFTKGDKDNEGFRY